jgi:hypothetical protein
MSVFAECVDDRSVVVKTDQQSQTADLSAAARAAHLRCDCPPRFEKGGSFRWNYPAFAATSFLDELWATEYARLDGLGQVYPDHTGYASSQIRDHLRLLSGRIFGNPQRVVIDH